MRNLYILLFTLLANAVWANDQSTPVEPKANGGTVLTAQNIQYITTENSVDWKQFDRVLAREDWRPPKASTLNLRSNQTAWIKFQLSPPATGIKNWALEVRWPHVSNVDFALWHSTTGLGDIQHSGKFPLDSRAQPKTKNILFPFELQPNTSTTVYMRVADSNFIYLPMMLFSQDDYEQHNAARVVFFSMAFGIMAVMILYNLSLYFAVRDKMYLFYSNTVFSSFLYILAISGYGRIHFWHDNLWLIQHASAVFAAYCFLSATYFFRVFLDLPRYGGWMQKSNTVVLIGFTLILISTFTPFAAQGVLALGSLSGISGLLMLAISFTVWRRGNASAIYFTLAWFGVGFSTTGMVMTLRGQIDYFPALEYAQASGFVIEIILLSLALADRIRRQRIAKEAAQASLLRLQEKTNKELEEQVAARTRELESAMVDLKSANRELAKLTKTDPLTNVNNRRQFDEVTEREIARAQRTGSHLSLMMIDIDHFKAINDTYGHVVGDKCLKLVAQSISQNVRKPNDMVARYGGEEFALILPETEEEGARQLAERIRKAIADIVLIYEGKTIRMTASFGVCSHIPYPQESISTLVKAADSALYQAKENGRNQVVMDSTTRN